MLFSYTPLFTLEFNLSAGDYATVNSPAEYLLKTESRCSIGLQEPIKGSHR